jgi:hypothetical protein
MRRKLWWLGIAVLAFALVGQYVAYRLDNSGRVVNAAWADRSNNFNDVVSHAQNVVQAQVQSVQQGPDIVIKAQGEPGGEIRIPTQNITVVVQSASKGNAQAGQTINVFRTGGQLNIPSGPPRGGQPPPENTLRAANPHGNGPKPDPGVAAPPHPDQPAAAPNTPATANNAGVSEELDDDPAYQVGESYLLALTDGPNGTQRPVSPAGRYRVTGDNHLQAVSSDDVSQGVSGRPVSDAVAAAQGRLNIPAKSQVQKRVTTPGMPTTGIPTDNLVIWIAVATALVAVTAGVVVRRRRRT